MSFNRVKEFVAEIGLEVINEVVEEQLLVVTDEARGVNNMVLDVNDSVLVLEQVIGTLAPVAVTAPNLIKLLELNRELVHGAFVVSGNQVLFRDTLQTENLDLNEVLGSINALTMGLTEFGSELVDIVA